MSIDRLPEQRLVQVVRQVTQNALAAKAPQRYGSDALITRRIFSQSAYDLQYAVTSNMRRIRVEFTPDDVTFGGAPVYKLDVKHMNGSNVEQEPLSLKVERQRPQGTTQVWLVFVQSYSDISTARLKFYFQSIGSGNFTASVLS